MKIKKICDIFERAGGSVHLAAKLDLHQTTVIAWERSGIPVRYWPKLIENYKLSPVEIYNASKHAIENGKASK